MSDANTGGPAFPCDLAMYDKEVVDTLQGMTLRDYFAAKALDRMMHVYFTEFKSDDEPFRMIENEEVSVTAEMIAEECYAMADAMLKAREA